MGKNCSQNIPLNSVSSVPLWLNKFLFHPTKYRERREKSGLVVITQVFTINQLPLFKHLARSH
ncbi:hypothetical protein [Nodularia sp. LEGE 04288]|uniref:hypothetical protein n=1 Tax=Nodularia sp. LEGE 04288 TaxID=1828639 RepID=UPI001D12D0A8|nr:hypothetical protein [Nodularia sp. LEGE 04288]